jgi:DNA polymerase I
MNQLLYGSNQEENIVAVHPASDRSMRAYIRNPDGIVTKDVDFYPFFFLSTSKYLKDYQKKHWIKELEGNNYYRYLCAFTSWLEMWDAIRHCMQCYNENAPKKIESYTELPVLRVRTDPVAQFLKQTGRTLFKGMEFNNLHRLQLSIKSYIKHGFKVSNPNRFEDRIIVIALSDNRGWEHVINGKRKSEKELLLNLIHIIQEKDPDVIEGHNICNYDLPFLLSRCERHEIEFSIGRDNSSPHPSDTRLPYQERSLDYMSYDIAGRHIIDTIQLLQAYDASIRALEAYGLKHAAEYFGFATKDRIHVPPNLVSSYWDNNPDELIRICIDDVHDIHLLSDYLSPSLFLQTQMLPFNYDTVTRLSAGAKIESILLREYIRQRHSIPRPEIGSQSTIGETKIFHSGLFGPIIELDLESLYSSIIQTEMIIPQSDILGIFPKVLNGLIEILSDLRKRNATSDITYRDTQFNIIQSLIKAIINSFYGYLGNSRALFNDIKIAQKIAESAQNILRKMIEMITTMNGKVIELDSNAVYFVPSPSVDNVEKENEFMKTIAKNFPSGITIQINNRYKRMLSYKKNNYALLDYSGKVSIKGTSLLSRSIEPFGREFIAQCISSILDNDYNAIHDYYVRYVKAISEHELSISDFARTEILRETYDEYNKAVENGDRHRAAGYEIAISTGLSWKENDKISFYMTGDDANIKGFENLKLAAEWDKNSPDENVQYYLKRLDEFAKRFVSLFNEQDYHALFSVDDLFGFSPKGIRILDTQIQTESKDPNEEVESIRVDPKIWLNEEYIT